LIYVDFGGTGRNSNEEPEPVNDPPLWQRTLHDEKQIVIEDNAGDKIGNDSVTDGQHQISAVRHKRRLPTHDDTDNNHNNDDDENKEDDDGGIVYGPAPPPSPSKKARSAPVHTTNNQKRARTVDSSASVTKPLSSPPLPQSPSSASDDCDSSDDGNDNKGLQTTLQKLRQRRQKNIAAVTLPNINELSTSSPPTTNTSSSSIGGQVLVDNETKSTPSTSFTTAKLILSQQSSSTSTTPPTPSVHNAYVSSLRGMWPSSSSSSMSSSSWSSYAWQLRNGNISSNRSRSKEWPLISAPLSMPSSVMSMSCHQTLPWLVCGLYNNTIVLCCVNDGMKYTPWAVVDDRYQHLLDDQLE
jgi:hypothetical protein